MKIFYGVQGTGNGHITRARLMAKALYQAGIEVKFLFTGREAGQYFEMDIFRDYTVKTGLTFSVHKGQVQYLKTAANAKPLRFLKDVKALDLSSYDLAISDFEPVTAWAAKSHKKRVLGIGHQYAFNHPIPKAGADPIARQVMKYFAPVDIGVGLHWHHFGYPILPPIIETPPYSAQINKTKIIVYLPFEIQADIIELLKPFSAFEFHVYTPVAEPSGYPHILCKPLSREGFKGDFYDCAGVISNAGFELASEALQAGKKILLKPLLAQMEQISNAFALKQLGFGQTMHELDVQTVDTWLHHNRTVRVTYPDVAEILVQWIMAGMPPMHEEFIAAAWAQVNILQIQQ